MDEDKSLRIEIGGGIPRETQRIRWKHIAILASIIGLTLAGLILLVIPPQYQPTVLFVVPAICICVYIIFNPYAGIYLYFLYEFLRPYDFIPQLKPLRLAMVIELITLISWLLLLVKTDKRFFWSRFHTVWLAFLALIGITVITSANNYYAYNIFQNMLITYIIFVISTNVTDSVKRLDKLIWLLLVIHLYFALTGIYNFILSSDVTGAQQTSGRVGTAFIADENDFALALNTMIPFTYFMLYRYRMGLKKILLIIILISLVMGVISSFSRGGWIGLVAAILYCVFNSKRKFTALFYIGAIGLVFLMFAPGSYWAEIQTIPDPNEATANARLNYWMAAVRMYLDHPIIGVGAGNGGVWMPYYITGYEFPATRWGHAFHGTIPQVMAELGSIGLILYLFMIYFIIKSLRALKRKFSGDEYAGFAATSIIGAIIAYLVSATFLSTAYYPQLWTMFIFSMILLIIYNNSPKAVRIKKGREIGKEIPQSSQKKADSPNEGQLPDAENQGY